jgi:arylsulfatase A-like enzyme
MGVMGFRTPNIDRIAEEGMIFTDYYAEQSCTAGRSAFITGQSVFRTGLSKVGLPGADEGMQPEDPTIAGLLKPLGYATGQFGKNHLGDKDEMRATITSNTYWDWYLDRVFLLLPANAYVGIFLETFKEYPPRQKAASFTIDRALEQLQPPGQ